MSEITEREAREALNRIVYYCGHIGGLSKARGYDPGCDMVTMVEFSVQELTSRDSERSARQQPITPEWCVANGARLSAEWYWFDDGVSIRPIAGEKWLVVVNSRMLDWSAECVGQVEDLRKALRGGA